MHALQDRYQVQELSTYQGIATPPVEPPFAKIKPIDVRKESESPQFFAILNAMLAYMPMLNEEAGLRSRLVKIGVVSGATFYISDDVTRTALVEGMRQGLMAMYTRAQSVRSSAELFGRSRLPQGRLSQPCSRCAAGHLRQCRRGIPGGRLPG